MNSVADSAKLLIFDLAATLVFLAVFLLSQNAPLAVAAGMALGGAQIGWLFARKKPIDAMQWMSLLLVLGFGGAALLTNDPRFVMAKPSLIYAVVGAAMLRPGWMNRYLPAIVLAKAADIGVVFGYLWSALMFASAALNIFVAMNFDIASWAAFMSVYAVLSKAALFAIQYAVLRSAMTSRHAGRSRLDRPGV